MVSILVLIYFGRSWLWTFLKNKLLSFQTVDPEICLTFIFLWKGLVLASKQHFVDDFSKKTFLILYSINWPNFIIWLTLLLEILDNMCGVIICHPVCAVMSFEINFSFLTKPFYSFFNTTTMKRHNGQRARSSWATMIMNGSILRSLQQTGSRG